MRIMFDDELLNVCELTVADVDIVFVLRELLNRLLVLGDNFYM